jgi:LPXTG-motif cell wall-anchored protein
VKVLALAGCLAQLIWIGSAGAATPSTDPCAGYVQVPGTTSATTSSFDVTVQQPVVGSTTDVEIAETTVVAVGPEGSVSDQTLAVGAGDAAVALATTRAAQVLTDAGLVAGEPVASAPVRSLVSSEAQQVVTADHDTVVVADGVLTQGPADVAVGPEGSCIIHLAFGDANINVATTTTHFVNVTTNVTNTYRTSAVITVTGVTPAVLSSASALPQTGSGSIRLMTLGVLLLVGGMVCLLVRRRLDT